MKSIKNLSDDFKGMGTGGYLVVPRNLLGRVLDTGTPFTPHRRICTCMSVVSFVTGRERKR